MTEPSEQELEARMQPGAFSQQGFLGPKERLADVLAHDEAILAELGISAEQLASSLERLVIAGESARGRPITVEDRWRVEVRVYPGFQICPWSHHPDHMQCEAGGGVRHASVDWTIHNLGTGQKLSGPGMLIHLMRAHNFFEGSVPARVDPRDLARLLDFH